MARECECGHIWAAIRQELPQLRDEMRRAIKAFTHEQETMLFDEIATRLESAVKKRLKKEA